MEVERSGCNIVVFDFETGGFLATKNPLVEVSFICYDTITLQEVGRYEALISPYYENPITKEPLEYTSGAMNIHGITIAQLQEKGKDLKIVCKEIVAFLKICKTKGRNGKPMLAGHNILDFDIKKFLDVIMEWFKIDWRKEVNAQFLDTLPFSRLIWPQTTLQAPGSKVIDHKLETCCNASGVRLSNAHRASSDTEANGEMVLQWLRMLRGGGASSAIVEDKPNAGAVPYKF